MIFEDNPIHCGICQRRVPSHLLACEMCYGAEDLRLKRPKPNKVNPGDGELIKGVPSISFSRAIERVK